MQKRYNQSYEAKIYSGNGGKALQLCLVLIFVEAFRRKQTNKPQLSPKREHNFQFQFETIVIIRFAMEGGGFVKNVLPASQDGCCNSQKSNCFQNISGDTEGAKDIIQGQSNWHMMFTGLKITDETKTTWVKIEQTLFFHLKKMRSHANQAAQKTNNSKGSHTSCNYRSTKHDSFKERYIGFL